MVDKGALRSSKPSSTNGDSKTSSGKAPLKPTTTRQKSSTQPAKKSSDQSVTSPSEEETLENGVEATNGDVEMADNADAPKPSTNGIKDKDGDDEMTVVVPPPKSNKLTGSGQDAEGDVEMDTAEDATVEAPVDPRVKAVQDIKANYALLERAVAQFDSRFTLRVLRSNSAIRKHLSPAILATVIRQTYPNNEEIAKFLLAPLQNAPGFSDQLPVPTEPEQTPIKSKEVLQEIEVYLAILVQLYLLDSKSTQSGAEFSDLLVDRVHAMNRRTVDSLSAKVYFYYQMFYEQLSPLPPSPQSPVVSIRQRLLTSLRTAVLRKDTDTQATITTILLRNYLSTSHLPQADFLVTHTQWPLTASNNQVARYLYYLGRIRAIQLSYTEAHEHLTGATRKSPSTATAAGFYQQATKLLIVVELLMGDIPDRAIFRQPVLERALEPYFLLVQAVRVGDVTAFQQTVQAYISTFRADGTYTLILRLRQNVIKTGIRMMSLSYSRISLRDICIRLKLESEESAEYIVAKAIRDGVIEATLDHERGFMKSKEIGDVYATREPGEAFHDRIRACLGLHDESVKAMRFPMNQHRLELKNAQEAREREREWVNEIQEGDMDDDDAAGDFDGL